MIPTSKTSFTGEWVWAMLDVPDTYTQQFGNKLQGGFLDIVQPILKRTILGWENSVLNLALRLEYVDYNVGQFKETAGNIYDHIYAIVPGISFRPSQQTVVRLNYTYSWQRDLWEIPQQNRRSSVWVFYLFLAYHSQREFVIARVNAVISYVIF